MTIVNYIKKLLGGDKKPATPPSPGAPSSSAPSTPSSASQTAQTGSGAATPPDGEPS